MAKEYEDVEYYMDDSITVAPAEDIPLDGTGVYQDYEEIQKKTRKKRAKKKSLAKKDIKDDEPKIEVANESLETDKIIEKETPIVKVAKKKAKKKAVKKTIKQDKAKLSKKTKKVETKMEDTKSNEPDIKPEPIKLEKDTKVHIPEVNPQDKESQFDPNFDEGTSGLKIFGAVILGIIIILAIIFGIGYFNKNGTLTGKDLAGNSVQIATSDSYEYNGFKFGKRVGDNLWYTYVKTGNTEYFIRLHHGPKELEDIPIEGDVDERFMNIDNVYVTFDPEGEDLKYVSLATGEIGQNFVNAFHISLTGACYENKTDACENRPIITCDNTDKPVIYFKESDETKVTMDGNCITIQGKEEGIIMAAERLLYSLYGIML